VPDWNTALDDDGDTDALLDAGDAQLAVQRERRDLLRVELAGVVERAVLTQVVRLVARHQDHGHGDAQDQAVGDAVVEAEGALERVAHQGLHPAVRRGRGLVAIRIGAHQAAAIVEHQAEADVVGADDVRAVDAEEPLGIDRGTEQVRVHAVAVAVVDATRPLLLRACDLRIDHKGCKPRGDPYPAPRPGCPRTHRRSPWTKLLGKPRANRGVTSTRPTLAPQNSTCQRTRCPRPCVL
jgi:hypothetical protein